MSLLYPIVIMRFGLLRKKITKRHLRKIVIFTSLFIGLSINISFGQKFRSEKGLISFFSDGAIEDILAENYAAGSLFDGSTGEMVFIVPILEFRFPKSLMREHFNEKYMETEKYPKSTFQGKISGFNLNSSGEQKVKAVGKLTMHGVTKEVSVPGTVEFVNGKAIVKARFIIRLQDYNIKIPTLVWQNIAEEVELKVDFIYKTL